MELSPPCELLSPVSGGEASSALPRLLRPPARTVADLSPLAQQPPQHAFAKTALAVPSPTHSPMVSAGPAPAVVEADRPAETKGVEDGHIQQMHCQLRFLRCLRLGLRALGGLSCLLCAIYGIRTLFDPNVIGFWEFCRWVSKALLGVLAALAGIYLEVSGQEMVSYFTKFAVNRVSTAFFYCWMGFYLMGTDYGADSGWAALMKFTGAIAWAVAFGDLMISCTSQGLAELQPKPVPDSSVASASKNLAARSASYLSDHVLCAMKSSKGVGIASASNQLDLAGGAADIESELSLIHI